MISNNKKAVIHIAKVQTGRTDEEYRDILSRAGVTSSKDLTDAKFEIVMAEFKKLGFKKQAKSRRQVSSKDRLLRKIKSLSAEMELDCKYADGIARKMFGICLCAWCDAGQLVKVVAALMYYKKRHRGTEAQRREK
jgi:phage gp16-like protein